MLIVFPAPVDAETVIFILGTQNLPVSLGIDLHSQFMFENLVI